MSVIKVEEINASLTRVEWAVNLSESYVDGQSRQFELNTFFHSGFPILKLSVEFSIQEDTISEMGDIEPNYIFEYETLPVGISFQLEQVKKYQLNEAKSSKTFQRPTSILFKINGGETYSMKMKKTSRSPIFGKWYSDNVSMFLAPNEKHPNDLTKATFPITSIFWIEFNTANQNVKNLSDHLSALYIQQSNSDVQFCFQDGPNIGGHVCILAARSPVFAAMFKHQMMETKTSRIVIKDCTRDIFDQMLHFIYSGKLLKELNEDTAQSLYLVSDKYEINDLKKMCLEFLLQCFCMDNVLNLMVWAHIHSVEEIKETALNLAVDKGYKICQQKNWELLIKNYPELAILATRRMIK